MKIKNSIIITLLVVCYGLTVTAQTTKVAYNDIQPNIVLAATVGDDDFKPFETRMLSKGTWEVKAIKVDKVEDKRLAWTSWVTISDNWAGTECNGFSRGWTTTFYISAVGMENINYKWSKQFPSAICRTQAIAIEKAKLWTFKLEGNSAVTFFLSAFYDVPKRPLGGGLILSLRKQQQQQQQQNTKPRSKKRLWKINTRKNHI